MKKNRLTLLPTQDVPRNLADDPRVRSLESRLEDGYARIEQARARGQDVTTWEDFWIGLLKRYELAAMSLPDAA